MSEAPRKLIIKPSNVLVVPEANTLIADALRIIQNQLTQIAAQSNKAISQGKTLGLAEARVLQGYIKALVELSKEERERSKSDDLSKLSDEELAELVQVLLNKKG
jgi:hypothetical protein